MRFVAESFAVSQLIKGTDRPSPYTRTVPISVTAVAYGRAATEHLSEQLSLLQSEDQFRRVDVVVNSPTAARALRRTIARGAGASVNVHVGLLADRARVIAEQALLASGRRRLTRSALTLVARDVVTELFPAHHLGHLLAQAEIIRCYGDLRRRMPEAIDRLAAAGIRQRDLGRVLVHLRERLAPYFFDDLDVLSSACQLLATKDILCSPTILHLPVGLSEEEVRFIAALSGATEVAVNLGQTGDRESDRYARRLLTSLERHGATCEIPDAQGESRNKPMFPSALSPLHFDVSRDSFIVAPDVESEVDHALRLVVEQLALGTAPQEIALAYTRRDPYADMLVGALDRSGIPFHGPSAHQLLTTGPARFLLCALGQNGAIYKRDTLLELAALSVSGIDGPGVVGEWDRVSRFTGLTEAEPNLWQATLREQSERSSRALVDESHERRSRARRSMRAAESFARFVALIGAEHEQMNALQSWEAIASWCENLLDRFWECDTTNAPADLVRERADVSGALRELARLDDIAPHPSLESFRVAFEAAMIRPSAPHGLGSVGVLLAPIDQVPGLDLELLVVLGAVEGHFPPREAPSPLLETSDRETIGFRDYDRDELASAGRLLVSAALRSARSSVVSVARVDDATGQPQAPSRLVAGWPSSKAPAAQEKLRLVARGALVPIGLDELETAVIADVGARSPGELFGHHLVRSSKLTDRLSLSVSRDLARFDRYSGRIARDGLTTALETRAIGPTTLETYAHCPFRYFSAHLLGIERVDAPERRFSIDPRDRGSLAHEVLERFVSSLLESPELDDESERELLASITASVFDRYERRGLTGKNVLWRYERRRLIALLEAERVADRARRHQLERIPIAVEHRFGYGDSPPVCISAGEHNVYFHGMIDRIDRDAHGRLFVTDYKTGQARGSESLDADPVARGRLLQLPVYALAAKAAFSPEERAEVSAAYRLLDRDGEERSVVLDNSTAERLSNVLETLVTGIERGIFPYHPGEVQNGTSENCRFCDFDVLCPSDRVRFWDLNRETADLVPYVALADGALTQSGGPT